jgi:hypothetical protein
MNRFMRIAVASLSLAMPAAAHAQLAFDNDVSVNFTRDFTRRTMGTGYGTNSGGGFFANFTIDFAGGPVSFNDWLVWCIDAERGVSTRVGNLYSYQAYTLGDFALSTNSAVNGHDPDMSEMRRIASLVNTASNDFANLKASGQIKDYQGSIWATFDGYSTYPTTSTPILGGNKSFSSAGWVVLWNGENQTFVSYVPEPQSALLLTIGLATLGLVVLRRRNTA